MMVSVRTETCAPKEKGRVTLSVRSPLVTYFLASLSVEMDNLEDPPAFGKMIGRDRSRFDIARRHADLFERAKKFIKADADRAWIATVGEEGWIKVLHEARSGNNLAMRGYFDPSERKRAMAFARHQHPTNNARLGLLLTDDSRVAREIIR